LNWRLGVDLLRVLAGADVRTIDWLDQGEGSVCPAWWRHKEKFGFVNERASEFASFRGGTVEPQSRETGVPIVTIGHEYFAVVHPLRTLRGVEEQIRASRADISRIRAVDCFTLLTAPSLGWLRRAASEELVLVGDVGQAPHVEYWVETNTDYLINLLKLEADGSVHTVLAELDGVEREVDLRWNEARGSLVLAESNANFVGEVKSRKQEG
jgi:hypothetical protein